MESMSIISEHTGINNVAACLISRKLRSFSKDAKTEILGDGMDHRVRFEVAGLSGVIENYPQWCAVKSEIVKRLGW